MLVIYNENQTSWQKVNVNNKTSKFVASRTLADESVRYLDVLISSDIAVPDMNKYVNMTKCETLYKDNTTVNFKNKDLKPFITGSSKYNTDILLLNITLKGKIIKNISSDKNYVIAYLIAKGELFLVMSVRDINNAASFNITLHDPHLVADKIYTFTKANGEYTVNVEDVQVDTVIENPVYKISHFRPSKPTQTIFVGDSNYDAMVKLLKKPENHKIIQFIDGDMDDVESYIEPLKTSGYKAVTMYANSDEFAGAEDKVNGPLFTLLKNNFKFVNVLLNNGKTLRK